MGGKRIEEVFDGTRRTVHAGAPLLSSSDTAWAGFLLERDHCREGRARTLFYPHACLVLAESVPIEVEDRALRRDPKFLARCGSVTLWPAGHEAMAMSWRPLTAGAEGTEMLRVQLDMSTLRCLGPDDEHPMHHGVEPQLGIEDGQLAALMRVMANEVVAGCPAGPLFAESLCLALATHVARRYGSAAAPAPPRGGLSPRQWHAVRDRIECDLGGDLSLAQLAAVAGLQTSQFAEAFRRSVGTTPHQYVLRRRIEKARVLLARQDVSVAELALALGFASQSHFTEVFRRFVGTTPGRFRQQH